MSRSRPSTCAAVDRVLRSLARTIDAMTDPRRGAARPSPTARTKRPVSPAVRRRRRTLALLVALVAIALIIARVASTSNHHARSASPVVKSTGSHAVAPTVVKLQAADAGWQLSSPLSRSVAFADGADLLVAGGLEASQSTSGSVERIDPNTGATTSAGTLAEATHDAAGAVINCAALRVRWWQSARH